MFKRAKVVMLPTNEKATMIGKYFNTNELVFNSPNHIDIPRGLSQHLYITSNDEIKKGDWFIANQGVNLCIEIDKNNTQYPYTTKNNEGKIINHSRHWNTKIIATTDSSLFISDIDAQELQYNLPQPSQAFIEKYVEEYNKGNIITDVLVEYEFDIPYYKILKGEDKGVEVYPSIVKIDSKDKTITIKKVKDSWNREEVEDLIRKSHEDSILNFDSFLDLNKWIEENL